jgi:hypothetical protein
VCNSLLIFFNLRPSLSPREGASDSVLCFSWFGEELHGKASLVCVWDPDLRSNGQKTTVFSTNTPDLKTSTGMGEVERVTWEICCRNCDPTKPGGVIPESPTGRFFDFRAIS